MTRPCTLPALVTALVALTACSPRVSDTGYTGTWSKGNDHARSTISIVQDGDRYLFRWHLTSVDENRWEVRCGWDAPCEEYREGAKVALYTFRTWVDEATGHLHVECLGENLVEEGEDVHYIDELVVKPGGKRLLARTLERSGEKYSKPNHPRRLYDKVSDAVESPPPLSRGGGR